MSKSITLFHQELEPEERPVASYREWTSTFSGYAGVIHHWYGGGGCQDFVGTNSG